MHKTDNIIVYLLIAGLFFANITMALDRSNSTEEKQPNLPWRKEEENQLFNVISKNPYSSWSELQEYFPDRSSNCIKHKYYRLENNLRTTKERKNKPWSKKEEKQLLEAVKKFKGEKIDWSNICKYFPERTKNSIRNKRVHLEEEQSTKEREKKRWSKKEEKQLLEAVKKFKGEKIDWSNICEDFPGRTKHSLKRKCARLQKTLPAKTIKKREKKASNISNE